MMEAFGRTNGIPFNEMGDEEQNKVKGLKSFWRPFGRQDNRSRNVSYCPQLYFAGGYRICSCMITNISYVEKMNTNIFTKEKEIRVGRRIVMSLVIFTTNSYCVLCYILCPIAGFV
jgi:hypothetical protein